MGILARTGRLRRRRWPTSHVTFGLGRWLFVRLLFYDLRAPLKLFSYVELRRDEARAREELVDLLRGHAMGDFVRMPIAARNDLEAVKRNAAIALEEIVVGDAFF